MKLKKMFFVLMATLLWLLIVAPVYAQGKEYSVKYGSKELYGILSNPNAAADKRQGIVILAHGFGGTHHFAYSYFEALNKLGYQAYAFDFAGGSPMSRSAGREPGRTGLCAHRSFHTEEDKPTGADLPCLLHPLPLACTLSCDGTGARHHPPVERTSQPPVF